MKNRIFALLALPLAFASAHAADFSYTASTQAQWTATDAWTVTSGVSGTGYPGAGDNVVISGTSVPDILVSGTQSAFNFDANNLSAQEIIGQSTGGGFLDVLGTFTRSGSNSLVFRASGAQSMSIRLNNFNAVAGSTFFGNTTASSAPVLAFSATGASSISGGSVGFNMADSGTAFFNTLNMTGGELNVRDSISSGTSTVAVNSLTGTGGTISIAPDAGSMGILQVNSGSIGGSLVLTAGGAGTFELMKTGTGTLYIGSTTAGGNTLETVRIKEGVLAYASTAQQNQFSNATDIIVDGGTLDLSAKIDAVGSVSLYSGTITGSGGARIYGVGSSIFDLRSGVVNAILGPNGSLVKSTSGTVALNVANVYTGSTSITGGVLAIANVGALGVSSSAASNLNLDGGVLSYVGSGAGATDRLFTLGINGGGLDSSGAGAVVFSNTGAAVLSGSDTARTFTLGGSNTGTNTYAGILTDNGTGATSLTKTGVGKWIITGNHSFTGATTVSEGTLQIGNGGGTGSVAGALVNNGIVQLSRTGSYAMSTVAGPVSGTGTIQVLTSNTVSFGSSMSGYSGTVASNVGGVVNISSLTALANTAIVIEGANRLTLDSSLATSSTLAIGSLSITNSYNLTNQLEGTTLLLGGNNGNSLITAGTLTAVGGLIKVGSGTFTVGGSGAISFAGGIALNNGTIQLASASPIANGNITFGGGILQYSAFNNADMSGRINAIGSGQNARIDTNGTNVTFATGLSGAGGLQKLGSGTLTLSVANTYQAGTTVSAGTLLITNSGGGGSGSVSLNGGRLHVNVSSGAGSISNAVVFNNAASSYVLDRAVGQSLAVYAASSDLSGGFDTTASILAGTAGSARTLTTSFNTIAVATNDAGRVSDVFSLSGTGTDLFVLQLDLSTALDPVYYLAWLSGGEWINAVDGNTGNNASGGQLGYAGSFAAFQLAYGSTLSNYVGAYGVDTTNGSVWAVLNHNSDFAVVPEPTTWALLGLGLGVIALRARSRRRAV